MKLGDINIDHAEFFICLYDDLYVKKDECLYICSGYVSYEGYIFNSGPNPIPFYQWIY